MQKRLLFGLAGGLVGLAAKPLVNAFLGLGDFLAFALCGLLGILLACLISIFVDVFSGRWEEADYHHSD